MKHPYPEHVVEAVARGMYADDCKDYNQLDPSADAHPGYYEYAESALAALWEASRVDTLDQLAQLPGDEVILGQDYWLGYTPDAQFQLKTDDLPAYVLHWGDTDE